MSANSSPDADHYETVVRDFKCGQVTPVLGAGANLTGRAVDLTWEPLKEHLPSGGELAEYLARHFHYEGDTSDLVRVSQYVAVKDGTGPLYEALHKIFDHNYDVTPLHTFLADLTASLRAKGQLERPPLLLTTNYDDLLERAFDSAGEKYDLVVYVAQGKDAGKFLHRPPGEKPRLIEQPDSYLELDPKKQTVILKIHGFVDRTPDPEDAVDSYVITEDHYIDYLSRTDLEKLLPTRLLTRLGKCHFLFLGYSLRDWNLRAILHRIWASRHTDFPSWAVQIRPDPLDERSWRRREVEIFDMGLDEYVDGLRKHLEGAGGEG